MDMSEFLDKIRKQLEEMSEDEKDAWILTQAKILPDWKQDAFYKSICGTKKVMDMPDTDKIKEFCEKVRNEDICVQYETHYVEFDEYGHFIDDWIHYYHDPEHAMDFIESVIRGCHDMIVLEDYEEAFKILDEIIRLDFAIEVHPDSDDECDDEFMDLERADCEGILSIDWNRLLRDYIKACRHSSNDNDYVAGKIVSALEMELFRECGVEQCAEINEEDQLLAEVRKRLQGDLKQYEAEFARKTAKDRYYLGRLTDEELISRIHALIEYFDKIGKKEKKPEKSFLRGTWSQIMDLIAVLKREKYIDDQLEIDEIWDIVKALIKRGGFDKEPWEVREFILKEIYDNDYYDYYGVGDPMNDLAEAICLSREENLKRAEIMMGADCGYLGAEAAKLYRELGEEDLCAEYFENHLGKEKEPYEILIDYYKERNHGKAVEIANMAIQKCKEDQTPFFLFLLHDARDRGDEATFKKLMQRAHRRNAVRSAELDAEFN